MSLCQHSGPQRDLSQFSNSLSLLAAIFFFLFLCFYKKKNSHINTSLWIVLWLWKKEKALTSWNSYNIDRETLCSFLWVTTLTLLKMVLPFNLYLNLFITMTNFGLILSWKLLFKSPTNVKIINNYFKKIIWKRRKNDILISKKWCDFQVPKNIPW